VTKTPKHPYNNEPEYNKDSGGGDFVGVRAQ